MDFFERKYPSTKSKYKFYVNSHTFYRLRYFDVDKAAEEHRGYISMLEANGIRVHTVLDILNEVGIDSLMALAEKVLVYDISNIPDEDAEATEVYRQEILQKMSRADLIRCVLLQPTVKLSKTDNNTGYPITYCCELLDRSKQAYYKKHRYRQLDGSGRKGAGL